jgi:hypothetical protein
MTKIDVPMMKELRGYVMLMMMRTEENSIHNAATLTGEMISANVGATILLEYNFTDKEIKFINTISKDYQFTDG